MRSIYALTDPRDGSIRYVGKSTRGSKRLVEHQRDKTRTKRGAWIRKLQRLGLMFGVIILESEPDDLDEAERFWIAAVRAAVGGKLTNQADGGQGGAAHKGHKHTPEARAKMRAAVLGRKVGPPSLATREKIRAALKGRPGVPHLPETCLKMSLNARRQWAEGKGWKGKDHAPQHARAPQTLQVGSSS